MELDPFAGDIQPLKNERAAFRRRLGDWRLFFDADPKTHTIEATDIERRTTTTYKKRR